MYSQITQYFGGVGLKANIKYLCWFFSMTRNKNAVQERPTYSNKNLRGTYSAKRNISLTFSLSPRRQWFNIFRFGCKAERLKNRDESNLRSFSVHRNPLCSRQLHKLETPTFTKLSHKQSIKVLSK